MSESGDDILISDQGASPVVSERVAQLAQGIYDEFQNVIDHCGPESVQTLAPLVVNILENLDNAFVENEDNERELNEITEKYELLAQQYEREKHRRKDAEERAFQLEDANDIEIRQLKDKVTSTTTENKNLSSKVQQQGDQIVRLQEESDQLKREATDLRQRNIESIKQYADQMDNVKEQYQVKLAELLRSGTGSFSESDTTPGFMDFVTPAKSTKKRKLPAKPIKQKSESFDQSGLESTLEIPSSAPDRRDSQEYTSEIRDERFTRNKKSLALERKRLLQAEGHDLDDLDEESLYSEEEDEDPLESGRSLPDILIENEELLSEKNELAREMREMEGKIKELQTENDSLQTTNQCLHADNAELNTKCADMEGEIKKVRRELQDTNDKLIEKTENEEEGRPRTESESGETGGRRLEWARLLKERNEFKEKYYALLDQVKLNDELSMFKSKSKKSKWLDYFTALFSPTKRREMEQVNTAPARRLLMGTNRLPGDQSDEEEDGAITRQPSLRKMRIVPTLKSRIPKREALIMSSSSWFFHHQFEFSAHERDTPSPGSVGRQNGYPNISTCRPMTYQEEGAKVMCASAVNPAVFLSDQQNATKVQKSPGSPEPNPKDSSISLVWVCTGVANLSKVSVVDAGGVGDVLETFPVSSDPIACITSVPGFDESDSDVLASMLTYSRKTQDDQPASDRPSSKLGTMWIGSQAGILFVHSSAALWKKCIHADKLPAPIVSITYLKGKVYILMNNGHVAVFRRFSDGEWEFDNYSNVVLGQRKELPVTTMCAVKFNVWCGIGNYVHVVGGSTLKMEAAFIIHPKKKSEIVSMVGVGDGVWVAIKYDPTIRLFHASSFHYMQDLDISPPIHRMLSFHSERRLSRVSIRITTLIAVHNALWIGTENGIIVSFPFSSPTIVAEEAGWEVMKEAEVKNFKKPEPLDVRIDKASDTVNDEQGEQVDGNVVSCVKGERSASPSYSPTPAPLSNFSPFCAADQMRCSVHCHVRAVKQLLCVPGLLAPEVDIFEPLQKMKVSKIDESHPSQPKPACFIISFGEGHLDLRTADKVIQTLNARPGQGGLPDPSSLISDKNYLMVWEQTV